MRQWYGTRADWSPKIWLSASSSSNKKKNKKDNETRLGMGGYEEGSDGVLLGFFL